MRRLLRSSWLLPVLVCAACASGEEPGPSDVGDESGADTGACREPRLVCGGVCIDPDTSNAHCGRCDNPCAADQVCAGGGCVAACPGGEALCLGECVQTTSDERHCGRCERPCGPEQTCEGGECRCPDGESLCGTECVDLRSDDAHCGDCVTDCKDGESCQAGFCVTACAEPARLCGDVCVDVRNNTNFCGDCDTQCGTGETCLASECVCSEGREQCGEACVDTKTNTEHCGDCDQPCPAGAVCRGGDCACPPGRELCDEQCVDTDRNPNYCGDCETSCGGGLCVGGDCAADCPLGETVCDDQCVDTETDSGFCGNCETSCRADQDCVGGDCRCPAGFTECDGRCVDTQTSESYCGNCLTACDEGETCLDGDCGCGEGLTDCSGVCVDTDTSGRHCGGCGDACGALETCQGGDCVCVEGLDRCGDACVRIGLDAAHCLGCNMPCTGGAVCEAGSCEVACTGGLEACDGACVDTTTDAQHCGECGNDCAPWERCRNSACACADDFWEFESPVSNGSASQNIPLPTGILGLTPHLTNLRLCGENADWYSVYVPSDGAGLDIFLDADCLDTILPALTLYDEGGTLLLTDEADGSGLCPALFATGLARGWVDLKVESTAGEGPYDLFVFPYDLVEMEPNEDPDTATGPIMADLDIAAELDDSGVDLDTFGIFNARPGRVVLGTSDGSGSCLVDTVMFVTDDLGVEIGDDDDSGPGLCSRLELDLPAGFFYAYVIGYDLDDVGAYELSVTYDYELEAEPNHGASFEGPFTESFGAEGVIFPRFDRDDYRLQLTAPASVRAWVSGVGWGCYIDSVLELSSVASGTVLGSDDDFDFGDDLDNLRGTGFCSYIEPTSTDPDHSFAAELAPGLYTLSVIAFSDRVGPYNLSVEIVP